MLQKRILKLVPPLSQKDYRTKAEIELKKYKKYVQRKLNALTPIFAKASIGDFSDNVEIPEEEDEFIEFYVGIQTMLEVIRDQLNDLKELNHSLEEKVHKRTKALNKSLFERIKSEKKLQQKTLDLEKAQKASLNIMEDLSIEITGRKRIEKELRKTQKGLEKQVHKRTEDLVKSNQELQWEIQERKRIENRLREQAARLAQFQAVLVELVKIDLRNLEISLEKITETAAQTIQVSRVSVWLFNEDRSAIVCQNLYELKKEFHSKGMRLESKYYPRYFAALEQGSILASAAKTDLRTSEFEKSYLSPHKIQSMMDIPIWLHGKIVGVVCYEQKNDARDWTLEEYDFAVSIAEIISLALVASQRKQTEEALIDKTHELARSNEELEQFAYIASHDLQEPLRMITSYTQFLLKRYQNQLGKEADEFIYYITDGATRMHHLIQDLLHYSRIGKRDQISEPICCSAVLEKTLINLQSLILENKAKIKFAQLPTIFGNEFQLQQLFQNFISNAIKFRRDVAPRIQISAKKQNKEWVFSFQDNGIGIDSEYFEKIFTLFQRLHTREKYPGTGIGLAICKKIVEQNRGKIWLKSKIGKGTIFYFTFPTFKTTPTKSK